jgi:D-sedoheptulose 7-phosphate isomerase
MTIESAENRVKLYLEEKKRVLNSFPVENVVKFVDMVWDAYKNGKTIYACGNGGNAAYVANLITDLANHPFVSDDKGTAMLDGIPRLRAIDLCSSSASITGIMNDLGPQYIFAQQLINDRVGEGDVLVGITGSGNSKNVLEAFDVAKKYGARTVAWSRGNGGKAKELADLCIVIPGTSTFPGQVGGNDNNFHFEDSTSALAHITTGIMRERIWDTYGNGKNRRN